jgi:hypothetical protein
MIKVIADTVNALGERQETTAPTQRSVPMVFLARITGATPVAGKTATVGGSATPQAVAWTYDWEEVSVNTSDTYETAKAYRRTSTLAGAKGKAFNGCEGVQMIGTTAALGPGITTANIPAAFTFKAIANNTVVLMYALSRDNGEPLFFFSTPNAVDGTCGNALAGGGGGQGQGDLEAP